ncbi:hypothetical protein ACQ4M3_07235 [Leptolyngbya sp. AN03gr2]|uniref:hypothetical protein n=1 Tax=unclassified Leptolyngbya TaxID=2650499 RepID=UPI003D317BAB
MEAIRRIQTVENGEIHLQLPKQFWGQEVEIIVLPAPQQIPQPVTPKKSLCGCLSRYAKPDLIAQEQDVWQTVVSEKHEHR